MGAHSRLSPSAASRWVACPGSVTLSERYPEPPGSSSESAAEGTASHWVGEQLLLGKPTPTPGTRCPENGVVLSMEMIDGAFEYAGVVLTVAENIVPTQHHVEDKIDIKVIHPECHGTCDDWFYLNYKQELHIWDYKYGWGIVEPKNNKQLICYAAGVIEKSGITDTGVTVVFHIFQPRPHHPLGTHREWRISIGELHIHINEIKHAAALALGPNPYCVPGPQCDYCRARPCATLLEAGYNMIDQFVGGAYPGELPPAAMSHTYAEILRAEQVVKAMRSGLEARMIGTLQAGGQIPGYSLESGYGRAAWTRPVAEVLALGEIMGVSLGKQDVITPVAARKLGLSDSVLAAYSGKEKTGLKLAATAGSKAALAFGQAQGV